MKLKNIFFGGMIFALCFNCSTQKNSQTNLTENPSLNTKQLRMKDLQNGDLIFVDAHTEELSGAISRATKISAAINYDHVGLIEKDNNSFFVLHAAPEGGSQRESLREFYTNQTQKKNQIAIYRLKKDYQYSIPDAIQTAKTMLGKPYNWLYILDENSLYCSDFVERAFREDKVFELIPMNFKNPSTGKIDDFWVRFYAKKGEEVPQDKPGTNPNQIATSEKLDFVGLLKL